MVFHADNSPGTAKQMGDDITLDNAMATLKV